MVDPLYVAGAVLELLEREVQFERIESISETSVVLSAMTWNSVLEVFDWNCALVKTPPGRDELSGRPYCASIKGVSAQK